MRSVEELAERVRARGGKVTPQRMLIYEALQGDASHPTAEQLHARLLQRLPHLSLSTVYAALHDLAAAGELRAFATGDGQLHFDPDTRPHTELVCIRCRRIEDVPEEQWQVHVPRQLAGYHIIGRTELYYGICPTCQSHEQDANQTLG